MRCMSTPLSIRFDPAILERLRRRARAIPGATPSGLARRLVDEGLRMADHPGITFKDGPSGRRSALVLGPDVWEVAKVVRELDEPGEAAVTAAAELLNLAPAQRVPRGAEEPVEGRRDSLFTARPCGRLRRPDQPVTAHGP
jgi:hypothetical protein